MRTLGACFESINNTSYNNDIIIYKYSKCEVYLLFTKTLLYILPVHISICTECTILFLKCTISFLKIPRILLLSLSIPPKNAASIIHEYSFRFYVISIHSYNTIFLSSLNFKINHIITIRYFIAYISGSQPFFKTFTHKSG